MRGVVRLVSSRVFAVVAVAAVTAVGACASPATAPELGTADREVVEPDIAGVARVEPPPPPRYSAAWIPVPVRPLVTAVPTGAIALAVTEDGGVAVTADDRGCLRLWPTLDGTREPVVVPARRAVQVALARDGRDLVIGTLDALGQLELIRVTAAGVATERVDIDSPRPFVQLGAARGFVARRDDQVLVWFDPHGSARGELAAPAGERVTELAARDDRVVAIVERAGVQHARKLVFGPGDPAWGAASPRLAIVGHVALSPGGTQLLAAYEDGGVSIFDLRTGRALPIVDLPDHPVGFAADDPALTRLTAEGNRWHLAHVDRLPGPIQGDATTALTAAGYVTAVGSMLAITTDETTRWLGYQMTSVTDLVPARRGGWLATDAHTVVHLDARFRADHVYELVPPLAPGGPVPVYALADDTHVVATLDDEHELYDLAAPSAEPVELPRRGTEFELERASGLAIVRGPTTTEFLRYDPVAHAFGPPFAVWTRSDELSHTHLVDPALAHGAVAIDLEAHQDSDGLAGVNVAELHVTKGTPLVARHLRHVEAVVHGDDVESSIDDGMPDLPRARRTSPDGALVAEVAGGRITVRTAAGEVRWTRPAQGATGLTWTDPAGFVVFGGSVARIDATTGAVQACQCGWRFGLWELEAPGSAPADAGLCETP